MWWDGTLGMGVGRMGGVGRGILECEGSGLGERSSKGRSRDTGNRVRVKGSIYRNRMGMKGSLHRVERGGIRMGGRVRVEERLSERGRGRGR